MEPIRKDTVVRGLLEHTALQDYRVAELVLDRLTVVAATDTTIQVIQRLNPSKHGRCPCCGIRSTWTHTTDTDDYAALMSETPHGVECDPED